MPITIHRVIRSKRKNLTIIILPDGKVEVRAPLHMAEWRIREGVDKHADWIHKQQQRVLDNPPLPSKKFVEGELFLFMGKTYPLHIIPQQHSALAFNGQAFCLANKAKENAKGYFTQWYKNQAHDTIPKLVNTLAPQHGLKFERIRISSARTRWGSCSSKGTLSFSWRLMMAPLEIVRYVVVHELVHTKIHNHSATFWQNVERILPDAKVYRKWLRKNGKYLCLD